VKKIRKRYRLGTLVAVIFLSVCALLANGTPGASAASTAARPASSSMTTVKFADAAVASAATRSTAPSRRPRGVDSCVAALVFIYGDEDENTFTVACNIPGAVPDGIPGWHWYMAAAQAACGGILVVKAGVGPIIAAGACYDASVSALPFTQQQWCDTNGGTACLNAWGGGPWVNDSTTGFESGDDNQNFFLSQEDDANGNPTGNYQLVFGGIGGSGSWAGQCIGDAYNNSGYADTSLDGCGNGIAGGAGWGTNMTMGTSGCPSGEVWFHDNHWNGYLGPGGSANGSHFYLNKPTPYCFNVDFF